MSMTFTIEDLRRIAAEIDNSVPPEDLESFFIFTPDELLEFSHRVVALARQKGTPA